MNIRKSHFPYCIKKVKDKWVLLNRRYEPIGAPKGKRINIECYALTLSEMTLSSAIGLSWEGARGCFEDEIFLYSDATTPEDKKEYMDAYLSKLEILLRMDDAKRTLRRSHFPYCIERVREERYVILNRDYHSIGAPLGERGELDDYAVNIKRMTQNKANNLSWEGYSSKESIYLYNDGTRADISDKTMSAYLKKLELLMRMTTKEA